MEKAEGGQPFHLLRHSDLSAEAKAKAEGGQPEAGRSKNLSLITLKCFDLLILLVIQSEIPHQRE